MRTLLSICLLPLIMLGSAVMFRDSGFENPAETGEIADFVPEVGETLFVREDTEAGHRYLMLTGEPRGVILRELDLGMKLGTTGEDIVVQGRSLGIGLPGGATADAIFEVESTTDGVLIPRMTSDQRDAIPAPEEGLTIYNIDCSNFNYYDGSFWRSFPAPPDLYLGDIIGLENVCEGDLGISYAVAAAEGATAWAWTVPDGATIATGSGTDSITVDFGTASGFVCVTAQSDCGSSTSCTFVNISDITTGGAVTGGTPICEGSFTGSLVLAGYTGDILRWQRRLGTGSWINIVHTDPVYSEIPASDGTWEFRAVVQSGDCDSALSASTTVLVSPTSVGGAVTGGSTISPGTSTGTLTLSGHTGTVVRWQRKVGAGAWIDISHTGTTYSEVISSEGTYYFRAVVQSGECPEAFSDSTTVVVADYTAGSATFTYTGGNQSWTVPSGVTSAIIECWGAQGGDGDEPTSPGGYGAYIKGTFTVTPGEALTVIVGGRGENGSGSLDGGGGGGGAFVRRSSTPLIIAAGGGGGSYQPSLAGYVGNADEYGGLGGYTSYPTTPGEGGFSDNGGGGGCGAGGGGWNSAGYSNSWATGGAAAGGAGGISDHTYGDGGFGGGGAAYHGGGGGGGYTGGNGGTYYYGGGGGGSYNTGTSQTNTAGVRAGNGQVIIRW